MFKVIKKRVAMVKRRRKERWGKRGGDKYKRALNQI